MAVTAAAMSFLPTATGMASAAAAYPATVSAISRADKAEGAKAHPDLLAEFGGSVTGRRPPMSSRWARPSPCSPVCPTRAAISP